VPVTKKRPYSMDRNLWHLSHEGGELEDPWCSPEEHVYLISKSPAKATRKALEATLSFQGGVPMSLNGKKMDGVSLLTRLNTLGASYGVGRVDMVENRLVGMKSRGVYETPGGTILYEAHRALQSLTVERDTLHQAQALSGRYADLVYNGQWFHPLREALDAFYEKVNQPVTGECRIRLTPGRVEAVGVRSPHSLYQESLATFGRDEVYNQKDAEGFIRLFGLPMKVVGAVRKKKKS
jgi:argininosuccinate synthase